MPAPTNAEIAYQQSGLLDRWTLYTTQLRDWLGGVATGGPNGDGAYPLQDVTGQTFLVPCVAAWQAKVDAIADPLTGVQATVDQSVTEAQAAQTAAATSESNAATSATAAQSAKSDADMYATNSANSAAAALTYKNAASASETNATDSATAAATSETNAANSASAAASSASDADTDATAAAQSAQAADASAQQAATYASGRLTYVGTWDVSGGTLPAIGNKGDFYAITGTATIGGVEYANGDMAVSDGSTGFNKIDNTDKVTSVAGLIGTISTAQLQTALNLGTAAYQPTSAFATAAQGAKADAAIPSSTSFNVIPGGGPRSQLSYPGMSFEPNGAGATGLVGSWGSMIMLRAWKAPGDTTGYSDLICNYNGDVTWRGNTVWHSGNLTVNATALQSLGVDAGYLSTGGTWLKTPHIWVTSDLGVDGNITAGALLLSAGNSIINSAGQTIYRSASLGGHVFQNVNGNGANVQAASFNGYTPLQQGGGAGQTTNKVYIGWSTSGLKCQVDSSDQGVFAMQPWVLSNFAPLANRPAIYVQSGDPGTVPDGSLWVW